EGHGVAARGGGGGNREAGGRGTRPLRRVARRINADHTVVIRNSRSKSVQRERMPGYELRIVYGAAERAGRAVINPRSRRFVRVPRNGGPSTSRSRGRTRNNGRHAIPGRLRRHLDLALPRRSVER